MNSSSKLHERFWIRMSEAFGTLWTDKHGAEPTPAWCAMLNRFDVAVIKTALERMSERKWEYAPSLPMFESWLKEIASRGAAQASGEARDFARDYWRSAVAAMILADGALVTPCLWPYGAWMCHVPEGLRASLAYKIESLTRELIELEAEQRDRAQCLNRARAESWRFVSALAATAMRPITPAQAAHA